MNRHDLLFTKVNKEHIEGACLKYGMAFLEVIAIILAIGFILLVLPA